MKLPRLLARRRRRLFARLIANGLMQAVTAVAIALLVRRTFERLADGSSGAAEGPFLTVMALLAAAIGFNILLRVAERRDAARLGEDYVTRIRLRLFNALTSGPVTVAKRGGLGSAMLPFVTDLTAVRRWICDGLARLLVSTLAITGGLIALAVIDPVIGLAVTGAALTAGLAGAALGRPLTTRIRQVRRRRGQLASHIGDRLRALGVVRLSEQVTRERRALSMRSTRMARAAVARARVASIVRVLPDAALGFSTLAALSVGGARLAAGEAAHGTIIAALSVLGALAPQARALGRVFEYWASYRIAVDKLRQVLDRAPRRKRTKGGLAADRVHGHLAFEDVSVAGTLWHVTAVAEPRSVVAVVGPNGGGKSSLLMAAAGSRRLDEGRILLDRMDISRFDLTDYARCLGVVSGEFPLLTGSLCDNLTYRARAASDEAIAEVCRLTGLADAIARLPDGSATRVRELGAQLPYGLRQRLKLARAILGDPAVLLLDDPESGLDPMARAALDRVLATRRFTVLLVTHDVERARSADIIWYLEDGRLLESGPAAAVLAGGGPTARFFAARAIATPRPARAAISQVRPEPVGHLVHHEPRKEAS